MEDFKKHFREGVPDIINYAKEIIKNLPDDKGDPENYSGWAEYSHIVIPLLFNRLEEEKVTLHPSMYETLDQELKKDFFESTK